jgi:regulator of protease activity HflC (stomatin/prohibitin superfamily)
MFQSIRQLFSYLLGGGRLWGLLRLVLVLAAILLFSNWGRFVWNEPGSEPASLIWRWGLRFWVMPIAAVIGAFLAGSLYVRRLHMLRSQRLALHYLMASAFSLGTPRLEIVNGKPVTKTGREDLILDIGGPGWLVVRPGSAVLVETLQKPTRVLGAGVHILTRLERMREFISLSDQHGMSEQVTAATKDGIEINAKRINYRYRLRTGRQPRDYRKRTTQAPYPYSTQAARNLVYQRTAFADSSQTAWDRVVKNAVEAVITDYLNSNQFDFATTPLSEDDPRLAMIVKLNAKSVRDRLQSTGTELLWFDIGEFEPKLEAIDLQRLVTWSARWSGEATLEAARADAMRLSAEEMARAEAQAEMLTVLTNTLRDAGITESSQHNLQKIIVMRTAQLLETMVESNRLALDRDVPAQPSSVTTRRWVKEDQG